MKKLQLTHEIHCSVEHFWEVFFDKGFNTTLYLNELGFPKYEILEQREEGGKVAYRKTRGTPRADAPAAVKKLMGDGFGYDEEGRFDSSGRLWTFKLKMNTLADKLRTEGSVRCEAAGPDRCKRIMQMEFEAKIFGVGSIIEAFSEGEMKKGWDQSAAYMNRWVKDHPKAG
ncbi:MAG: DUF2505 domain-containing protein [Deltaproteobacteria bacterium]|nr:DUF2505 domain-containing protein [Deltaproteobacteria bacterium]